MELAAEPPIDRVALNLGPLHIYWYAVIIAFGALLGVLLAIRESNKRGYPKDTVIDFVLFAVPIAIIGARTYYVFFKWEYYSQHLSEIYKIWHGGIAIHGALIGGVVTMIVFTKVRNLSFWKFADVVVPGVILGQAIGRWGNFVNQEAHGGVVTRGFLESLHLPNWMIEQLFINGAYYAPAFLYESLADFAVFIILLILRRQNFIRRGEVFLSYLMLYSFGRFFIEGIRQDSLMLTDHLRVAQVLSILLIAFGLFTWWFRRYKGYADKAYLEDSVR